MVRTCACYAAAFALMLSSGPARAAQTIDSASLTPTFLERNVATPVTATVVISDPSVIPTSVNLQRRQPDG